MMFISAFITRTLAELILFDFSLAESVRDEMSVEKKAKLKAKKDSNLGKP